MNTVLRAGVARRIISPPKGIYLIGYGDRFRSNRGVHDDLTATGLVLDDGATCVVLIAADLLCINEQIVQRVQDQIGDPVLICCSHTHAGPIAYADHRSPRRNRRYIDFLVAQLIAVAHAAKANVQPATLAWSSGEAHIAVNRRERKPDGSIEIGVNPEGVVDRSLGVVQVQTPEGQPLAHLVNFSCHNTVLGPKNLMVSADWTGAMRKRVEEKTEVPLLFFQGTTGDLNPDHEWGDGDREAVERLGAQVSEQVLETLSGLAPFEATPVRFFSKDVWLPLEAEAETVHPPPVYRGILAETAGVPQFLVDLMLKRFYPWKTTIAARDGFWQIPMKLNLLRVGEWVLVALGMEVFNEIGLAIKADTPTPYAMVASVSNGCVGYLPSAAEYALGGYEVDITPYIYRLPARLVQDSETITLQAVRQALASL